MILHTRDNHGYIEANTRHQTGDLQQYQTNLSSAATELSPEHRDYLMQRHGTLDLEPMPGFGDADPYNWSPWKVCYIEAANRSNLQHANSRA